MVDYVVEFGKENRHAIDVLTCASNNYRDITNMKGWRGGRKGVENRSDGGKKERQMRFATYVCVCVCVCVHACSPFQKFR